MKIAQNGSMATDTLPGAENAVVCGKCGFPFRATHPLTDNSRTSCPRCGERGTFRKATDADLAAYAESRKIKPSDYLKAAVGLVVIVAVVAIITWSRG